MENSIGNEWKHLHACYPKTEGPGGKAGSQAEINGRFCKGESSGSAEGGSLHIPKTDWETTNNSKADLRESSKK